MTDVLEFSEITAEIKGSLVSRLGFKLGGNIHTIKMCLIGYTYPKTITQVWLFSCNPILNLSFELIRGKNCSLRYLMI